MRTRTGNTLYIDMGSLANMKSSCLFVELGIKTIIIYLSPVDEPQMEVAVYSLSTNFLVDHLKVQDDIVTIDWLSWQGIGYVLQMPGKKNLKLLSAESGSS